MKKYSELERALSLAVAALIAIVGLLCVELMQSRKNERAMSAQLDALNHVALDNMALQAKPSLVAPYVRPIGGNK